LAFETATYNPPTGVGVNFSIGNATKTRRYQEIRLHFKNMAKKRSVVIEFCCHSFISSDIWSQMLRVVVPLWRRSFKVDAKGQLAERWK
jgi:hypothetical protein